jgi:hypothetical protein
MKVELTKEGYIKVIAETIIEAWALNGVWPIDDIMSRDKNEDRVIVDCTILMPVIRVNL